MSSTSFPIINLCQKQLGATIYCDAPSFSDEYSIENLIVDSEKGYLASSFIKPPLDITISFNYPINLERIGIKCKVGTCLSDTISIYVSDESMNEINDKVVKLLNNNSNNRDIEMKSIGNSNNYSKNYLAPPTNQFLLPKGIQLPINIANSNGNDRLSKSTLYDNINLLGSNVSYESNAKQKYIHQQFNFVGSIDKLHSQDDLYTYICNSDFNYHGQTLPNSFLSKIQKQSQLKPFHSNSNLLISVKSIRIRILKIYQSSCACIGGIEIWGTPSSSTPLDIINQIYTTSNNYNNSSKNMNSNINNPFKSNLLSTFNNNNNNNSNSNSSNSNGNDKGLFLDIFPKNKHYHNEDVMKIEVPQQPQSILSEFEEILKSHPEIKLNETGIPTIFLDPITLEMMINPVILKSGNIVDRSTIETHFKNGFFTDPFTGLKMVPNDIETNHLLKSQIQSFITEKKKRKRLLKSHSMILRNQILANMQPQIATVDNHNQIVHNNSNTIIENNENGLFNSTNSFYSSNYNSSSSSSSSSQSNSLASSTSSTNNSYVSNGLGSSSSEIYNILNSTNINFQNAEVVLSMSKTKDPSQYTLAKMPSQFSFIELPIKKNKK